MTQPGIQINAEAVRKHARVVDATADTIDTAVQAGAWVRSSNDAYGLMFGWVATTLMNPAQDELIGALKDGVTAAQATADLLRSVADSMDITDENAATRLGGK